MTPPYLPSIVEPTWRLRCGHTGSGRAGNRSRSSCSSRRLGENLGEVTSVDPFERMYERRSDRFRLPSGCVRQRLWHNRQHLVLLLSLLKASSKATSSALPLVVGLLASRRPNVEQHQRPQVEPSEEAQHVPSGVTRDHERIRMNYQKCVQSSFQRLLLLNPRTSL
jgi:hypothetical protein